MTRKPSKILFSQATRDIQQKLGSRQAMQKMEDREHWQREMPVNIQAFVASRDSVFLGTASADGQPYIQHRGGAPGFLNIDDAHTISFTDMPGNRQYISIGNLSENPNAFLFMIDYQTKNRIKFWGRVKVENLTEKTRKFVFDVEAWDVNCQKLLPELYSLETVQATMRKLTDRIAQLEEALLVATQKTEN